MQPVPDGIDELVDWVQNLRKQRRGRENYARNVRSEDDAKA